MGPPRSRLRRWLRRLAAAAVVLALLWLGGLVWFAETIPEVPDGSGEPTDAIVVLTGGSQRLQSGLRLLAAGRAKKLFISGVHPGVELAALLRSAGQAPETLPCCVVLGHAADNTFGNAVETAAWMRQEHFTSLRLVTSNYHMRRALLEFSRAMPEVRVVPNPVFPEAVKQERWWASPGTLELILAEYDKYLWALVRPLSPGAETEPAS
ncbi:MAG TPA: YdcF family protein [Stellaceae bacterium]|nr:YdcF family protein [Stellaceae bacterium]